ncbi:DUF397 domain-containing protein [Couchioplanes caeruleus]|uniref:DUF397 domain-containing protein n=2 Tax=Couchioplanes caeruleus TaxID=56438 RepID=A0A1K0FBP3_9ACTN|nr:DUF397 domain-containing protein [Couchioplanes caeruleus]OJF10263.1 DUF397 domain-containing protein [Couchioplanes caeruleus subsp. caeruleus]ROP29301.1 uncharacterized protein DUF397 [Couchioplanes caeruleus]
MLNQNWRTSSRSGGNGQCVEVRRVEDAIQVRDSKDRSGPVFSFSLGAWEAIVAGVKAGEFDL